MRWTLTTKTIVGVMAVVILGLLSMLAVYKGLLNVRKAMRQVIGVEEPLSAVAYELEINTIGTGLGVLKYLETGEPHYRARVDKDKSDLARFQARYDHLAYTREARELGQQLARFYEEYVALGETLMDSRDQQAARGVALSAHFERLDHIIDEQIQLHMALTDLDRLPRALAAAEMEINIAEVGTWLGQYLSTAQLEHRARVQDNADDFRAALAGFKTPDLSPTEQWWVDVLDELFEQTMALIEDRLTHHQALQEGITRFLGLRRTLDDLLDGGIQVLAQRALVTSSQQAERTATTALWQLTVLIPLFIGLNLLTAGLLLRAILRPLRRLMRGTATVGAGDLRYRLPQQGRDEFAALARQFNQMVAQLEATTVSKALLEASEADLQQANAVLRQEVAARQQAQEALRRSEIMAAMGTLVAGVAHDVRTPLFGISATLDAFEARFGQRQEFQRYLGVLREAVQRLHRLTQALLEYGRPFSQALAPGSIAAVVAAAVQDCTLLAAQGQVRLASTVLPDLPAIRMEPGRLRQALQNLIENAVQHSPRGATVAVVARQVHEDGRAWVECTITDGGPGFPLEVLPRVFEPFFSRRRGGTGIGLAIVQRIVEEHGGWITVDNRPTGGAVATVRLPGLAPSAEPGASGQGAEGAHHTTTQDSHC